MAATDIVTLRLPAKTRKRLDRLAHSTERTRAWLAADAIEKYLEINDWQVEAIREGIREADAGKFVSHEDVLGWVDTLGTRSRRKRRT